MKILRTLGTALSAATLASGALVATAPTAGAVTFCREATVGELSIAVVCVSGDVFVSGTVASGQVAVECVILESVACNFRPVQVGPTGFELSQNMPQFLEVDPATASVKSTGWTIGRLYVNGSVFDVRFPAFCVGDPAFC